VAPQTAEAQGGELREERHVGIGRKGELEGGVGELLYGRKAVSARVVSQDVSPSQSTRH
jgi:hypothetical protein